MKKKEPIRKRMLKIMLAIAMMWMGVSISEISAWATSVEGNETNQTTTEYHYQKTGEPVAKAISSNSTDKCLYELYASTVEGAYIVKITPQSDAVKISYTSELSTWNDEYNLVQLEIGEGLEITNTVLNTYPFEYIYLPSTFKTISPYLLQKNTTLKEITIPKSVTTLEVDDWKNGAFYKCTALETVIVEEGSALTNLNGNTFSYCSALKSVTLPESVTSIPSEAFYQCTALENITIPKSVTTIGSKAFAYSGIKSVTFEEDSALDSIGEKAFYQVTSLKSMDLPEGMTTLGKNAFSYCSALESVTFPTTITSIGGAAFSYCTALNNVVWPESVDTISGSTFSECTALDTITIPESVKTIEGSAFNKCGFTALPEMPGVETLKSRAFYLSKEMTNPVWVFPKSLKSIETNAVAYYGTLNEVRFEEPSQLTELQRLSTTIKYNYKQDTMVYLPASLQKLDLNIFEVSNMHYVIPTTDEDTLEITLTGNSDSDLATRTTRATKWKYTIHSQDVYNKLHELGVPDSNITFHAEDLTWEYAGETDGVYTYTTTCDTCGEIKREKTFDENGYGKVDDSFEPAILVTKDNYADLNLTEDYIGYYAIQKPGHLYWFSQYVNGTGKVGCNTPHLDADMVLLDDIELNDMTDVDTWTRTTTGLRKWEPIGTYVEHGDEIPYQGNIDGRNHVIKGMFYNAFVGYLGKQGSIKDIGIGAGFVYDGGALTIMNNGKISDSYTNIMLTPRGNFTAGIAWENYGEIDNCYNSGNVTGEISDCSGICGMNMGIIRNCYNEGAITSSDAFGICYWNMGLLEKCYNTGTVTSSKTTVTSTDTTYNYACGGISGTNSGLVENCYNTGDVSTPWGYAAGITSSAGTAQGDGVVVVKPTISPWEGSGSGTSTEGEETEESEPEETREKITLTKTGVYFCYNTGTITSENRYAGGIAGGTVCDGTIYGCYNTGNVTGGTYAGGIAAKTESATIQNCYSYGNVSLSEAADTTTSKTGGIVGYAEAYLANTTVKDCYFLGKATDLCYGTYLNDNGKKCTFTNCVPQTAEEFASGAVTYNMQTALNAEYAALGESTYQIWGQKLSETGADALPKFAMSETVDDNAVVRMTFEYSTGGKTITGYGYTNYNSAMPQAKAPTVPGKNDTVHEFIWYNEDTYEKEYDFSTVMLADNKVYAQAYDLYALSFSLPSDESAFAVVGEEKVTDVVTETDETVTFKVSVMPGYTLSEVTLDGTAITPDDSGNYTISDIKEDHAVVIATTENDITLTYQAGEHGKIYWNGAEESTATDLLEQNVKCVTGTLTGVIAVADLGYHFVGWKDAEGKGYDYGENGFIPPQTNGVYASGTYIAAFEENEERYTISGKVVDEEGRPVANMPISMGSTKTDVISAEDGSFSFTEMKESVYQLYVYKMYFTENGQYNGWKAMSDKVSVTLAGADKTDVTLTVKMQKDDMGEDFVDYKTIVMPENLEEYFVTYTTENFLSENDNYYFELKEEWEKANLTVIMYEAALGFDGAFYKMEETGTVLERKSNRYEVPAGVQDYIVEIDTGVYSVTTDSDEITIVPTKENIFKVIAGEDYSFKVTTENKGCMKIYANNEKLTPDGEGVYTIKNVTKDQKITCEFVEHTYDSWTTITEATCMKAGKKKGICSVCRFEDEVEIPATKDITNCMVSGIEDAYTYTGSEIKPEIILKDGTVVVPKEAYTVRYTNNIDAGTATINISGTGEYKGTITKNFVIEKTPEQTTVDQTTTESSTQETAEEKLILEQKNDKDIKGSAFGKLCLRMSKVTKNSIQLKWNKVKDADGYIVYGNRCNSSGKVYKLEKISETKNVSYTHKQLKKGTYYKYVVRAYKLVDGVKETVSVSKTLHITTTGGKYVNYTSVKVPKTNVTIKKGKKYTIKAKAVVKKGKKAKTHKKLAYESSNTKIATVSSKGVVKAKKKGTCYIYVYAQNGVYKKIKVKVK